MEIILLSGAESDLLEHFGKFGEKFRERLDHSLEIVRTNPEVVPKRELGYRRKYVPRTPVAFYYQIHGDRIVISAILDQRIGEEEIERRLRRL